MRINCVNNYITNQYNINKSNQLNFKSYFILKSDIVSEPVVSKIASASKAAIPVLVSASLLNHFDKTDNDKLLKNNGVSYFDVQDSKMIIATSHNGGYYTLDISPMMSKEDAKKAALAAININHSLLGGLVNYKNCVDDLNRQDILKKGMRVSTYNLNVFITNTEKSNAASIFNDILEINIKPDDLFFIEDDAFYYDKLTKTMYSMNYNCNSPASICKEIFSCKYETDDKGNAIGYTMRHYDRYSSSIIDKVYREQQKPSEDLPPIANTDNNKRLAESFRFGNSEVDEKTSMGVKNVLKHLSEKVGIQCPDKSMLQIVKYSASIYDEPTSRIGYYNAKTGRSLIYDRRGKYLYQMEYVKDAQGNIIAATKF